MFDINEHLEGNRLAALGIAEWQRSGLPPTDQDVNELMRFASDAWEIVQLHPDGLRVLQSVQTARAEDELRKAATPLEEYVGRVKSHERLMADFLLTRHPVDQDSRHVLVDPKYRDSLEGMAKLSRSLYPRGTRMTIALEDLLLFSVAEDPLFDRELFDRARDRARRTADVLP